MNLAIRDKGLEVDIRGLPPISIHWSVALVAAFIALPLWDGLRARDLIAGGIVIAGILLSILAHELGHALTARRLGLRPVLIRLHWAGGEAVLEGSRPTRRDDRLIIIAGPFVNIALGLALLALHHAIPHETVSSIAPPPGLNWSRPPPGPVPPLFRAMEWLGWLNLIWAAVNLLPAFPLDGGHLFYSLVEQRYGHRRALLWIGALGVAFSIVAKLAFILGILSGLVILAPPDHEPNMNAMKEARRLARTAPRGGNG